VVVWVTVIVLVAKVEMVTRLWVRSFDTETVLVTVGVVER
jgi:hypothetical protein